LRGSDLTTLNVVDVECTCWEGKPPPGEEQEIIEVGICSLDCRTMALGEAESFLIRPARSKVSVFCTRLTTLTPEQVAGGIAFADACSRLRSKYQADDRVWASYGEFDREMFGRQCQAFGVEYPFVRRHLNVKTWCALSLGLTREVGMAGALERLKLPLEGTHHRGGDDARNIARILATLLQTTRTRLGGE